MTRADMIAEVRRRLGEDTADFWQDTDIIRNLDQAVIRFTREDKWPWLYTVGTTNLLAGQDTLTLPADVDYTRAFNVRLIATGEQPLILRRVNPVEGYRIQSRHYQDTGKPRYFYVASGQQVGTTMTYTLKLVPKTDKGYTVDYLYLRRPAALTTDTQEPDLPEDYHEAVVALATAQLWQHELIGGEIKSREQMETYITIVERARRELYRLQDDEEVVLGREQDEEQRRGFDLLPAMPDEYGRPSGYWW